MVKINKSSSKVVDIFYQKRRQYVSTYVQKPNKFAIFSY